MTSKNREDVPPSILAFGRFSDEGHTEEEIDDHLRAWLGLDPIGYIRKHDYALDATLV